MDTKLNPFLIAFAIGAALAAIVSGRSAESDGGSPPASDRVDDDAIRRTPRTQTVRVVKVIERPRKRRKTAPAVNDTPAPEPAPDPIEEIPAPAPAPADPVLPEPAPIEE